MSTVGCVAGRRPVTHGLYMREYVEVSDANYIVDWCVSVVDNGESICPTIASDTEWLARKLPGMCTEQEGRREIVDEEAIHIVKSPHRKPRNATVVRSAAQANIQELGGAPRETHSARARKQNQTL